jgi:hypothetical protein
MWYSTAMTIAFLTTMIGIALSVASFIQAPATGAIDGSVYSDRGQVVSGAMVIMFTKDGSVQRRTRTNAQGGFTFSGLPAGSYVIQGCAEEFGPTSSASVEVKAAVAVTQDLKTEAGFAKTADAVCGLDTQPTRGARKYIGETMSIDLKGDIREFLRQVASLPGLELDVDRSISRNVTLHLKDIPWDLALDIVLGNSGLRSERDGAHLRVTPANPLLGQNRPLLGTVTIQGKVTRFNLQNPRTLLEMNAPNADGAMQTWSVEWQGADYLKEIGVKANTFNAGEQIIATGSLTRRNTIDLVSVRRLSDGFSWGDTNAISSAKSDGLMFVSSSVQ